MAAKRQSLSIEMGNELVHFYRLTEFAGVRAALERERARSPGHHVTFWQPSLAEPFMPGELDPKLASYTVMNTLGLFDSSNYGAVLLSSKDGMIDHRSAIMPRFARFPFMAMNDLQIGATFTRPDARGRGLALRAVLEIVYRFGDPGRTFWYLTDEANIASVAVIRKAGFQFVGTGGKHPRYGLRFLGFYDMAPAVAPPQSPPF